MEPIPLNKNNPSGVMHTQHVSLVHTEFVPEKDIPNDGILREDYEKLRITYELQRDTGSEIEIDLVLNRILDRTFEFLGYDRAMILLVNKRRKLKTRAYRNISDRTKQQLSTTLIKHVVHKREGVILSDLLTDNRFNKADSIILSGMRSSMAVPILHKDEVLGVIVIESSKKIGAFTKKDLLLIMNIANHTAQSIKNSLLHEELRISFDSAIRTLSATVDAKHTLTAGHSERVAKLTVLIAKELGMKGNRLMALNYAALLHDIGKIGIPDKVLLKNGPMNDSEREEMNTHPAKTQNILENFHFPKMLKNVPFIAALHHEKVDGKGYPGGLTGSELPLEAKILGVADAFDAMTSLRDYPKYDEKGNGLDCKKMSVSQTVDILEKESGAHFDAAVVAALKKCLLSEDGELVSPNA
jgi:HD-GYP domain-containing protein (c-di-GMP phosphodiesterase class II)